MEEKKIKDKNLFFANEINITFTLNNIKNSRKSKVNLKYTEREKKKETFLLQSVSRYSQNCDNSNDRLLSANHLDDENRKFQLAP